MILSSLVKLAHDEKLLANPDYEPRPVAYIVSVDDSGRFLTLIHTADTEDGKKAKGKVFDIPRRRKRTSGASADFLVDKSEYVLGVEPDGKRSGADLELRSNLFLQLVQQAYQTTKEPALSAVAGFLADAEQRRRATECLQANGYSSNDLFAFEYRGQLVHDIPSVRDYFGGTRRAPSASAQQCLVCGSLAPPVENHPGIKLAGGTSSGVALVSFNSNAFESYGLSRNQNAPVCLGCADAYTTALKRLLGDGYPTLPRRHVRLSPDTVALFWADEKAPILNILTDLFNTPQIESVRGLLQAPHAGRMPDFVRGRFYCLFLSGAQGRAVLRGMHTGTVAELEENIRDYFRLIDIGLEHPLPLVALMRSLVLQGKLDNLQPELVTNMFLAIVFGRRFPQSVLSSAAMRCRAEQKVSPARAAVLKAYLIRNHGMEITVGLDKSSTNRGYRLGRLMAVLERVQGAAQNKPNRTIVDRYYGAASTRPATVLPRLIALTQHHLAKLTGGANSFYQMKLGEVLDGIVELPSTLNLEEQGAFALGYYHQRQDFFKKADPGSGDGSAAASEGEEA